MTAARHVYFAAAGVGGSSVEIMRVSHPVVASRPLITDTPISTNPDAPLSFSHLHALCVRGLGARAKAARALLVRMGGTHRHPFEFLVDSRRSSPPPNLDSREFWRIEIFGARLTRVCVR